MIEVKIGIPEKFYDYINDWNYEEYFNYGGYGSGKSDATAFKLLKISFEEKRLILVTRKVYNTLSDSCYTCSTYNEFNPFISEFTHMQYKSLY